MLQIHQNRPIYQQDAWFSVIACFLLQILSGFVQPAVHNALPTLSKLTLYLSFSILILLVPIIYLSFRYGRVKFSDILLRRSDFMVLFMSLIVLFVIISFISIRGPYQSYTFGGLRISQLPLLEYYIVLFAIFLIGPFLEELLFRKYIFEIFRRKYHIVIAIVLISFSETFLHLGYGELDGLIFIFLLSTFFTLVYIKSNLGGSFIIHCLTNFFIYFVSWR